MACNASGDVKVPSCSNRGRMALSGVLLRKRAHWHSRTRLLSSHESTAAQRVPKERGDRGV